MLLHIIEYIKKLRNRSIPNMNSADRMIRARVKLLKDFPFFGMLALKLIVRETKDIDTLATNGTTLYYNETFVDTLKDEELNFIYVHEIMHCVLGHIWRKGTRNHQLWNVACDFAIHDFMVDYMDETKSSDLIMPKGALYDTQFKGMNADKIYEKIQDKQKQYQNQQTLDSHQPWDGAGLPGNSSSDGDDEENEKDMKKGIDGKGDKAGKKGKGSKGNKGSKEDKGKDDIQPITQEDWEQAAVAAHQAAAQKGCGNMPASLQRLVDNIVQPQKNWRELLAEHIVPIVNDYNFDRPDARYSESDFFMPDFSEPSTERVKVVFWIDTSASVTPKELTALYSEIVGCVEQFGSIDGYVGCFDTSVKFLEPVEDVDDILKLVPKGFGGTDFHAPFNYMVDNDLASETKCMVMLTDGEASYNGLEDMLDMDILWIMTNDNKPEFGRYAKLEI